MLKKQSSEVYNFIKIETPAQAFSCEFCKISTHTFSYRKPQVTASDAPDFPFTKSNYKK